MAPPLAPAHGNPLLDAETLKIDANGYLTEIGARADSLEQIEGQYMGIVGLSAESIESVLAAMDKWQQESEMELSELANRYLTDFLQALIHQGFPLKAVPVDGGWLEVDTSSDLATYETLWRSGDLHSICELQR